VNLAARLSVSALRFAPVRALAFLQRRLALRRAAHALSFRPDGAAAFYAAHVAGVSTRLLA